MSTGARVAMRRVRQVAITLVTRPRDVQRAVVVTQVHATFGLTRTLGRHSARPVTTRATGAPIPACWAANALHARRVEAAITSTTV